MFSISILLPDLRSGGVERLSLVLATEFIRLGHRVEFVLMQAQGELLPEARDSFNVIDLKCRRARNLTGSLTGYLRDAKPGALLAAMWPLTVIAPIAARRAEFRGPVIVSEHGILSAQYRPKGYIHGATLRASTALGYRLATARVAVSSGVADDMAALAGVARSKVQVIHNPVARMPPVLGSARAQVEALWGAGRGARYVTVSRLKAVKNHELLLRAFSSLASDSRLMIVGNGEREADLRTLAASLGISDRVIFAGFRPDPTPFYATADVFVLSSHREGFGNVIIEALAQGTPVVSTDCPFGPAEILENGRYGRLTPVGDAAALARALQETLLASHDPDVLKARAREFSPKKAAKAYLELLLQ